MDLYPVFEVLEATSVGQTIRESTWLFPAIEAGHLLALALLGGAVLMVDFRLLGVGVTSQPAVVLERDTRPYVLAAIAVLFATGIPLALSEALKLFDNRSFWVKMVALALALAFTFVIRNPLLKRGMTDGGLAKAVGLLSMALWLTVAGAGRWIGFS